MGVIKQVINLIKSATKEQWINTAEWFLYTLIGGLVPLWLGVIILMVTSSWRGWDFFVVNGEFALYSASLLAPTIHILVKDTKKPGFKVLILFSMLFLIISTALYTTVTVKNTTDIPQVSKEQSYENQNEKQVMNQEQQVTNQKESNSKELFSLDLKVLKILTLWIFVFTMIIAFFATLLENVKAEPNVEAMKTQEMNDLKDAFDNLSQGGK